jgi:hypothetical protein
MPPDIFCLSYFSDGGLAVFAQIGLDHYTPTYILLHSWDYRCRPTHPAYLLRWVLANFLPQLTSNLVPPYFYLLRSWDYRHVPPHPVLPYNHSCS